MSFYFDQYIYGEIIYWSWKTGQKLSTESLKVCEKKFKKFYVKWKGYDNSYNS